MRSVAVAACACLSVTVGASEVQRNKPDFSGRWMLVEPNMPASIPPAMAVRQVSRFTDVRGEPMVEPAISVAIDRHFQTGLESTTYDVVGAIGGSHGSLGLRGAPPTPVHSTRFSTKWDGESLVIDTAIEVTGPNPSFHERHEVWSLDPKGILTIVVGEKGLGTERITRTVTYRRGAPDQSLRKLVG